MGRHWGLAGLIQSEKQKGEGWTATKLAVVLFFAVGFAVIPVLALLTTFRCATMLCPEPGWEAYGISVWMVAWPIAWVVVAAAFYQKRRMNKPKLEIGS